jgi:hypothetical protein
MQPRIEATAFARVPDFIIEKSDHPLTDVIVLRKGIENDTPGINHEN